MLYLDSICVTTYPAKETEFDFGYRLLHPALEKPRWRSVKERNTKIKLRAVRAPRKLKTNILPLNARSEYVLI